LILTIKHKKMKKYIFSALAVLMGLASCKKDAANKTVPGNRKTAHVSFNMGFSQSTGIFAVKNESGKSRLNALAATAVDPVLAANAKVLYVGVYQADGTRLFLTKQLATDTAFGKVNYNLPAGTYTFVFIAGQNGLNVQSGSPALLNNSFANYTFPRGDGHDNTGFQDTFFQKISVTVGTTGINQSVSLARITGQIVLNIEDAIPANVKFIIMYSEDGPSNTGAISASFNFSTASVQGIDGSLFAATSKDTAVVTGVKNKKLVLNLVNTGTPHQIRIFATDRLTPSGAFFGQYFGQIVSSFTISNVPVQANHQTILSGKLFGGNGTVNTGGFQITVDPVWDPTITTIPFQ